ncbi:reduced folate transporter isoform X1 [Camelus bactrianus]|uniref:Reduced folate transporter isoform X1 n=1 Tax=Camelus bactrianus TaxID=9837 RepID=A0AC58RD93_CAMBA
MPIAGSTVQSVSEILSGVRGDAWRGRDQVSPLPLPPGSERRGALWALWSPRAPSGGGRERTSIRAAGVSEERRDARAKGGRERGGRAGRTGALGPRRNAGSTASGFRSRQSPGRSNEDGSVLAWPWALGLLPLPRDSGAPGPASPPVSRSVAPGAWRHGALGPGGGEAGPRRAPAGPRARVLVVPGVLPLLLRLHGSDAARGELHHALPPGPRQELHAEAGHQRNHAGTVVLLPGCAGARLPADRLPALQAGAAAAGPELRVRVAPPAVRLVCAAHAAHGALLQRHHGCPHCLLLLRLLARAPRPLPARGRLLAGRGAARCLHQLRAGPAAGHCGPRPLLHAQLRLAGLPHLQPGPCALPEMPQAQPLLQPQRARRGLALRAGPDEPGPRPAHGRQARAGCGLAGLGPRSCAPGAGPQPAAAAAAPLVPLVGLQLHRLLPHCLLRAHPVERGQPHHGLHKGLQRRGRCRLHSARCHHLLCGGLREDPLGGVGEAGHRGGDCGAGRAGLPHVQDGQHLAVLHGLRALPRLLPVPGAHRHFSDRVFSFSRAPCAGLRSQHIPRHCSQDDHHPHRLGQAGPGPPSPLSVSRLLHVLPGALCRLLLRGPAGGAAAPPTGHPPAPAASPGTEEPRAGEGRAGRGPGQPAARSPAPGPGGRRGGRGAGLPRAEPAA